MDTETTVVNPYPGAAPYRDTDFDRKFFFGRTEETRDLIALLLSEPLVLVFARSGAGKSSLINAGLTQELRDRGYFPIVARVSDKHDGGPVRAIIDRVREEAENKSVVIQSDRRDRTLWEFFEGTSFQKDQKFVRPVLILDQFEELFTVVPKGQREPFLAQLADLAQGRAPELARRAASAKLEKLADTDERRARLLDIAYGRPTVDVKILIAMREDFLPEMEALKKRLPAVFRHTFRLEPLTRDKARLAIVEPSKQTEALGTGAFTIDDDAVETMLSFLAARPADPALHATDDIEPMHLEILCRTLLERVRQKGRSQIRVDDLGGNKGMAQIIRAYYNSVLREMPFVRWAWSARRFRPSASNFLLMHFPRAAVRNLCEHGLILASRFRNTLEIGYIGAKFGVPESDLKKLVDRHLLRSEPRRNTRFFELSHDSLVAVLVGRRWQRRLVSVTGVLAVLSLLLGVYAARDEFTEYVSKPEIVRLLARTGGDGSLVDRNALAQEILAKVPGAIDLRGETLENVKLDRIDAFVGRTLDLTDADVRASYFRNTTLFIRARNADISGVTFERSELPRAEFSDARIRDTQFRYAMLDSATFAGATLERTDFTGASLDSVDFRAATVVGEIYLSNSNWWLAKWSQADFERFRARYPNATQDYATGEMYQTVVNRGEDQIKTESNTTYQANLLNNLAWHRAIHGAQLEDALDEVNRALAIDMDGNTLDTKAYILMQLDRFEEANAALEEAFAQDVGDSRSRAQWLYRHGVILERLGREGAAEEFRKSAELGYVPTHELLLVPRLSTL
jgi:uncharacterized protein YjbI with pentapeptide repeats